MNLQTLSANAKVLLDGLTLGKDRTVKGLEELYSNPSDRMAVIIVLAQIARMDPAHQELCREMVEALRTWQEQPVEVRFAIIQFISDTVEEQDTLAGRPNPDNEH